MSKELSDLMKHVGRSVAGGAFTQAMTPPTIPSPAESVLRPIQAIVEKWERETPSGKHLVVTMQTADGQFINMVRLRPAGGLIFQAEGTMDGSPCMILAHINQLNMFFQYQDDSKISKRVRGFTVEIPEAIDHPQESVPPIPENK